MSDRVFAYTGFDPAQEPLREALHTTGNGYFATRGAAPESRADGVHYPATYVAGIYNRLTTRIGGRDVESESIVNVPNWLPLTFRIGDGDWFDLARVEILEYQQEFDVLRGVLSRRIRFRDAENRTTHLAQRRIVHMRHAHLAALETVLLAEDWSGRVTVRSALDGRVENRGVARYRDLAGRHLVPLRSGSEEDLQWLESETVQSRWRIAEAARTHVLHEGERLSVTLRPLREPGYVAHEFDLDLAPGEPIEIEKVVALYTSRDHAITEPLLDARQAAEAAPGFDELLASHTLEWEHLMRQFGIGIGDGPEVQLAVSLHITHLLQVVSENTIGVDVGVPARGLHGEAYRGHVFWDELFVFPFLTYRMPELTRSLLLYRYRRLPQARLNARAHGFLGAMFPWQSASNGREENQVIHLNPASGRWLPDNTELQRHINIAIAYNVWQYYQITADVEFMSFYGAEMLVEIARFWASIASYDRIGGRYEIKGVMGPDEYHDAYPDAEKPGLDNNAYTNVMVAWVMCRTHDALELLPDPQRAILTERLAIGREELQLWEDMSRGMRVVFHQDGVISQFEGYEQLEEFDWAGYSERHGDIQRLDRVLEAEGLTPNRFKVSKQADVLMLFYLLSADELCELFDRLGYPLDREVIPRTIDYYTVRTSHGSTLSRVVHSWVLARGDRVRSWEFFKQSLDADIADVQGGTTAEGIHLGAMAGSVDILQRGYTGLEPRGDMLYIDPVLPDGLRELTMRIRYRGQWMDLDIDHQRLRVTALGGPPGSARIGMGGAEHEVCPGQSVEVPMRQEGS